MSFLHRTNKLLHSLFWSFDFLYADHFFHKLIFFTWFLPFSHLNFFLFLMINPELKSLKTLNHLYFYRFWTLVMGQWMDWVKFCFFLLVCWYYFHRKLYLFWLFVIIQSLCCFKYFDMHSFIRNKYKYSIQGYKNILNFIFSIKILDFNHKNQMP